MLTMWLFSMPMLYWSDGDWAVLQINHYFVVVRENNMSRFFPTPSLMVNCGEKKHFFSECILFLSSFYECIFFLTFTMNIKHFEYCQCNRWKKTLRCFLILLLRGWTSFIYALFAISYVYIFVSCTIVFYIVLLFLYIKL